MTYISISSSLMNQVLETLEGVGLDSDHRSTLHDDVLYPQNYQASKYIWLERSANTQFIFTINASENTLASVTVSRIDPESIWGSSSQAVELANSNLENILA